MSLGIAVLAFFAGWLTFGLGFVLGGLGLLFAVRGLRRRERYRELAWVALILNAALLGYFIWLLQNLSWVTT